MECSYHDPISIILNNTKGRARIEIKPSYCEKCDLPMFPLVNKKNRSIYWKCEKCGDNHKICCPDCNGYLKICDGYSEYVCSNYKKGCQAKIHEDEIKNVIEECKKIINNTKPNSELAKEVLIKSNPITEAGYYGSRNQMDRSSGKNRKKYYRFLHFLALLLLVSFFLLILGKR